MQAELIVSNAGIECNKKMEEKIEKLTHIAPPKPSSPTTVAETSAQ